MIKPAERWPATFGGTIFETYPYLLPMCVAASLTGLGAVLGFFYLPETASFAKRHEARGMAALPKLNKTLSENGERRGVTGDRDRIRRLDG